MVSTQANLASYVSNPVGPLQPYETSRRLPTIPADLSLLLHLVVENEKGELQPAQAMMITI
eukprot:1741354-Pleurochrysis_carterae.AAC.1